MTIKAFVHGNALYRDVYSPYGPFYYELFGGFFTLSGRAVSTDASRLIVLVVWLSASLLYGIAVQRLTGLLVLGLAGLIVAFGGLGVLVQEPMHPQGLLVLLLGALTLIVVSGPPRRAGLAGAASGALLAMLVLTKVNLGGFAIAAVAFAAVLAVAPLYHRRWLRWLVLAAFLALPLGVAIRDVRQEWVRDFVILEMLSAAALIVAAWPGRPPREEPGNPVSKWLVAAVLGFAVAFVVIVGIVLLTGPSPADVFDGTVRQALRIRDAFVVAFVLSPAGVDWGIAAFAAAVLAVRLRASGEAISPLGPGLTRLAAGLAIWFTIAKASLFSLNPAANEVTLPLVLAWVAALSPTPMLPYQRFVRFLLPALAVAETLQTYPVAGSQVRVASVLFVSVGAICIADGLGQVREWNEARGPEVAQRAATSARVAAVALACVFGYSVIVRPAMTNAVSYHEQAPLPFKSASLLRLSLAETETYRRLVDLIHHYRCTTLVGYPSLNSLYLWSGLEAPEPQLPGPWVKLFDAGLQQRVVDEVRRSPRPCAIRNEERAGFWLQDSPRPDTPLVRYIFDGFTPVSSVENFEFLLPSTHVKGLRAAAARG